MDPTKTVRARCEAVGLDDGASLPVTETIRVPAAHAPVTVPSGPLPVVTARELPRISVELRGTLSGPGPDTPSPSQRERDLEVLGTLGEGGMGRVFLARQHSLDRDVAIKTIRDTATASERAALLAEGAVTGHLEHPGVVPVHALGVDEEGRPVLVMKRVQGAPWSDLLEDPHHAAWQHLGGDADDRLDGHLDILMQVCNAVEFAHSRGVLHRDIKPQNVLIGLYGEVYLADWGLALRLEGAPAAHPLCGTPAYMAPEMVVGGPLDVRTDVYLLGATLHQIVTGAPRHVRPNLRATLVAAHESLPYDYPPSVPEALAALANAATSPEVDQRPASAAEVRRHIVEYQRRRSSVALARSAGERLERLRALLASLDRSGTEDWQRDMDVLGAEAGFALEQAAREWPDNPAARSGAQELERLKAARRSRVAELERLARELDPAVSRRQRAVVTMAVALVGVGLSISALVGDGAAVTTRGLLWQSLGPLGVVALGLVVMRRTLLGTLLNRRAAAGMLVLTAALTTERALGVLAGVSAPQVLMFDCLVVASLSATAAAFVFRWMAAPAVILLVGAVWAATAPAQAMAAFSACTGVSLLVVVGFVLREPGR